jgi:rhodanese-related sulfurtransferase
LGRPGVFQLNGPDLAAWLADPARPRPELIDVREPWEFAICHIEGARLLPMNNIAREAEALDPERELVVICHHGVRSHHVCRYLDSLGFSAVFNLQGGVDAWARQVDVLMNTY